MEYWPREKASETAGEWLELRARITLSLIEKWGAVAGTPDGEDSAGRAKLGLLPPSDLIERCIQISEQFVATIESRGWIHPDLRTAEEVALQIGEVLRMRGEAEYPWRTEKAGKA